MKGTLQSKFKTLVNTLWMKLFHPSVKTHGTSCICCGTEILIKEGGCLSIGEKTSTQRRVTFSVVGGKLSIGRGSSFNRNDIIVCRDSITIGNNCAFGPNVVLYDHDHVFDKDGFKSDKYATSPIVIEDSCWLGANVIVLRGTHIGKGCVIGAGTIIKGVIPPHSVVKSNRNIIIDEIRKND